MNRDDSPGVAFVVFGKTDPAPVDTSSGDVGRTWGYRIDGQARGWMTGAAVAAAGDVNRDALADVIIGAPLRGGHKRAGRAYVVFGAEEPEDVLLGQLGDRGFAMVGGPGRDAAGAAVAPAGDADGDGFDDVVVGAPLGRARGRKGVGSIYLVRGAPSSQTVRLRDLGNRGIRFFGVAEGARLGGTVASYTTTRGLRLVAGSFRTRSTVVIRPIRTS